MEKKSIKANEYKIQMLKRKLLNNEKAYEIGNVSK